MKIISGGQTGVDRGAMDAAISLGIPIGGWAPLGWIAEDGLIPEPYRAHMRECPVAGYHARTRVNVRDSDGTLIVTQRPGELSGGTFLTESYARVQRKPYIRMMICERTPDRLLEVAHWIATHRIRTMNVAGPRESKSPGIQVLTCAALTMLLAGR